MTNKEYITVFLDRFVLSEAQIDLILFENQLNPEESADVHTCKEAIWNSLASWDKVIDITEGQFADRLNEEAYKRWYARLSKDIGKNVSGMTIII